MPAGSLHQPKNSIVLSPAVKICSICSLAVPLTPEYLPVPEIKSNLPSHLTSVETVAPLEHYNFATTDSLFLSFITQYPDTFSICANPQLKPLPGAA